MIVIRICNQFCLSWNREQITKWKLQKMTLSQKHEMYFWSLLTGMVAHLLDWQFILEIQWTLKPWGLKHVARQYNHLHCHVVEKLKFCSMFSNAFLAIQPISIKNWVIFYQIFGPRRFPLLIVARRDIFLFCDLSNIFSC